MSSLSLSPTPNTIVSVSFSFSYQTIVLGVGDRRLVSLFLLVLWLTAATPFLDTSAVNHDMALVYLSLHQPQRKDKRKRRLMQRQRAPWTSVSFGAVVNRCHAFVPVARS